MHRSGTRASPSRYAPPYDDDDTISIRPVGDPRRPGRKPQRRRRLPRPWPQVIVALLGAFAITISWSVGNALTVPGGGSTSDRLAEWARDHYLGPVVTLGEWLTYKPPKKGGKPAFSLVPRHVIQPKPSAPGSAAPSFAPPPQLASLAGKPLPGEGEWRAIGSVRGEPAIYSTFLRASSVYTSYVSGIVSMNQSLVSFQLRPGSEDPGPGRWGSQAWIPPGTRTGLMATFNGGFKINSSDGGFYLNGARSGTLTSGTASVVYYRNGRIGVGIWGQTVTMAPDIVGVRQNLHLIVQNGVVPAAVDSNVESSWGATLGGGYYVWRSGVGITADGRVIFVYGPALNVRELAELLQRAGAVNAMQLDINPEWTDFMYYSSGRDPADPAPAALLPNQQASAYRYYSMFSRDFTAVYAR
jgi:phosphodiester glycosidase